MDKMDPDYRKYDMTRFFDFTKLITDVYDQLPESYDIAAADIQDSETLTIESAEMISKFSEEI
ncbi:MAG: hypothetical protein MUW56_00405 [Chryseobacterium sp.]|uniref:hypothetical protein n=1 Tax=Chryseobacterium sp. TaxID=1871047 RepID=UPI0025C54C36|nr:hypothetical protein [Chryseobacterium sp.]MCJ7932123.1 hypothetical protein [Chryseobacterium sp.]